MSTPGQALKGKKALVLGLGVSGQSAVSFLLSRGCSVAGTDRNRQLAESNASVKALCGRGLMLLPEECAAPAGYDFIVASPGIPQTHPCYARAKELGIEVIGEIELACREIRQPCLGITGTNGKTTVTLLVEHVLKSAGMNACALGNVGMPLSSTLACAGDGREVLVVELSSFQLETLESVFLDAAVLLNITPDHLDRYASMEEYASAKIKIGGRVKRNGQFFVEEKCYGDYRQLFSSQPVLTYGYSPQCHLHTDLNAVFCEGKRLFVLPEPLRGRKSHDAENLLAAFGLCSAAGVPPGHFLEAFKTFKKPSHRIEHVRTLSGVKFIDDSKGTNIDAVIRAVEGVEGKVVLIAGGVDKGFPYACWTTAFGGKVKAVCAIGQSRERIKSDLEPKIPVELFDGMEEAVFAAARMAEPGDSVLLSPGCSSFDMFTDYAHRGREFQRIVNSIES